MAKKYKYTIGNWVEFKKHYKVSSSDGKRFAYEIGMHKPITGQIAGAINRYIGKLKTHYWDHHNEHPYLVIDKSITFYLIKTGMINVAYEVKEEDIVSIYKCSKLPWKENNWNKSTRLLMADYAADRVRNTKGEFI